MRYLWPSTPKPTNTNTIINTNPITTTNVINTNANNKKITKINKKLINTDAFMDHPLARASSVNFISGSINLNDTTAIVEPTSTQEHKSEISTDTTLPLPEIQQEQSLAEGKPEMATLRGIFNAIKDVMTVVNGSAAKQSQLENSVKLLSTQVNILERKYSEQQQVPPTVKLSSNITTVPTDIRPNPGNTNKQPMRDLKEDESHKRKAQVAVKEESDDFSDSGSSKQDTDSYCKGMPCSRNGTIKTILLPIMRYPAQLLETSVVSVNLQVAFGISMEELREILKDRKLNGYYRLKRRELFTAMDKQIEMIRTTQQTTMKTLASFDDEYIEEACLYSIIHFIQTKEQLLEWRNIKNPDGKALLAHIKESYWTDQILRTAETQDKKKKRRRK